MIKIGKYYYKNFWAFIQVVIFRKPPAYFRNSKGWKPKSVSLSYDPYEGMDEKEVMADLLYGDFHEECGDRD